MDYSKMTDKDLKGRLKVLNSEISQYSDLILCGSAIAILLMRALIKTKKSEVQAIELEQKKREQSNERQLAVNFDSLVYLKRTTELPGLAVVLFFM